METAEKRAWNGWTASEDARLRELAESGVAYKEISAIIGRGRNSCIGRAHRLGIISTWTKPAKSETPTAVKRRAAPIEKLFVEKPKPAPAQDNRPQPLYAQPEASTTAFGVPRTLLKLEARHCRFAIGERNGKHMFCCGERLQGKPYCVDHAALCYRETERQSLSRLLKKAYR